MTRNGAQGPHTAPNKVQEYVDAIVKIVATKGFDAANAANHEALRVGLADTEMFQAAARYLVGLRLIQTGTDA